MTNQQIVTTLRESGLRTLGDLDKWRTVRRLSRWQALSALVGAKAADRVLARLAAKTEKGKATP